MPRIRREIFRRLTDEERVRHAEIRREIEEELEELKADARRAFARKEELARNLEILRGAREKLGLSLTEVAARTGIDKSNLSRLESADGRNPTIDTLARYAEALGKRLVISIADATANSRPSTTRKSAPAARRKKTDAGKKTSKTS